MKCRVSPSLLFFQGLFWFCAFPVACAQEEPGWQQRSFAAIEHAASLPSDEAIPALSSIIGRAWHEHIVDNNSWAKKPDYKAIYDAAQAKLLAIPGHAEWHRDQIERERAEVDPADSSTVYIFQQHRQDHIETLGHLPSPETVRVLGEMLDDPRDDSPPRVPDDTPPEWIATRHRAVWALGYLGIANPPAINKTGSATPEERLFRWKLWYAQVKAGTRTFRFEGSKVEHRLGPVPAGRRPVKDGIPVTQTAAGPRSAAAGPAPSSGMPVWPWLAATVFLTVIGLWWLKLRRA